MVIPLYRTERYLPELLESLERQQGMRTIFELECVFVDDGSPDESGAIAQAWLARTQIAGLVIVQANQGVSAARNAGLDAASGDWISFIDSDDFVSDGYVLGVQQFLAAIGERAATVDLVSCRVVIYREAQNRFDRAHALDGRFARGDRLYRLADAPEFIEPRSSAWMPRERLLAAGVRFIESLHASEDALFVAAYLSHQDDPHVACVASSEFYYRVRAAGDSVVQQYSQSRDYYFGRFERGYLPLFERVREERGSLPRWLGQYVLYDLRWMLQREVAPPYKATHLDAAEQRLVIALLSRLLRHLDPEWIREFSIIGWHLEHRNVLLALMGAPLVTRDFVQVSSVDLRRDLVEVRYYFAGDLPVEAVDIGARPAEIVAAKIRRLDYFGQEALRQRILWVRLDGDLSVALDGIQRKIIRSYPWPQLGRSRLSLDFDRPAPQAVTHDARSWLRRGLSNLIIDLASVWPRPFAGTRYERPGKQRARLGLVRHSQRIAGRAAGHYAQAWLCMDRVGEAGDNAEALYWYLDRQAPEVNAFFVIAADSPDWERLRLAGARLLAYGGACHRAALMHAEFVISSHLDDTIVRPMPKGEYLRRRVEWKFVYLQHGVRQHDLSHWFNTKPIAMITAAAVNEWQELVADNSRYTLTTLQAKLTGFPRHDALVRLRHANGDAARRQVIFAPTWRKSLTDSSNRLIYDLESTEFGVQWFGLLRDERLRDLARLHDVELLLMPHPHFRSGMGEQHLPSWVSLVPAHSDQAALLVRANCVVTDYSSIFFDAAVAGAHIAYFQFDSETYLHGAHTYTPGEWDYEAHGFGPIAHDIDAMVSLLASLLDPAAAAEFASYRERVSDTLPLLDGNACARVHHELTQLSAS